MTEKYRISTKNFNTHTWSEEFKSGHNSINNHIICLTCGLFVFTPIKQWPSYSGKKEFSDFSCNEYLIKNIIE